MKRFVTKTNYRKWLEKKPRDEILSVNWGTYRCPLALYYNGKESADDRICVQPSMVAHLKGLWRENSNLMQRNDLPEWANKFAKACDQYMWDTIRQEGICKITVGKCLEILDGK